MKKAFIKPILLAAAMMIAFVGCGKAGTEVNNLGEPDDQKEPLHEMALTVGTVGISEEQAVTAVREYCYSVNTDLKSIEEAGEYPVYWEIESSDEKEIVVLFRSYTGALIRYYIDRATGDTSITEFMPGITDEEEPTGESFNIWDYVTE